MKKNIHVKFFVELLHCARFSYYYYFVFQHSTDQQHLPKRNNIDSPFLNQGRSKSLLHKHICVKRPNTVTFISKYPSKSWCTSSLGHTTPSIRWRRLHGWDCEHLCFPHQLPVTNVRTPTPPSSWTFKSPRYIYINIHSRYRSPGG